MLPAKYIAATSASRSYPGDISELYTLLRGETFRSEGLQPAFSENAAPVAHTHTTRVAQVRPPLRLRIQKDSYRPLTRRQVFFKVQ